MHINEKVMRKYVNYDIYYRFTVKFLRGYILCWLKELSPVWTFATER